MVESPKALYTVSIRDSKYQPLLYIPLIWEFQELKGKLNILMFIKFYYNYFQKNEKFNVKDNRNRFQFVTLFAILTRNKA